MVSTALAMVGVPIAADATSTPTSKAGQVRLSGSDRYQTAVAVSKSTFASPQDAVFIGSGEDFPDALAGGPAAAKLDAPTLLVRKGSLPAIVGTELGRLKPSRVYILGGTGAVSDAVSKKIATASGAKITRVSGSDRYVTAAAAAKLVGSSSTVYLASGEGFADALGGGAAAAKQSAPLLLTRASALPDPTKAALKSIAPTKVVVLGGKSAVSAAAIAQVKTALPQATVKVYAGSDRYETAAMIAKAVWPSGAKVVFHAPGSSFPDALGGTPAAKVNDAPILLTKATCTPAATADVLKTLKPTTQVALGGPDVTYVGAKVCLAPSLPPTKAQANALRAAKSYLEIIPFSEKGLIDQLSSEYGDNYDRADAEWAVAHLDVNWKEQAVKAAKNYLDIMPFSRQGLIDQLSSEYGDQFTLEQATYAADKVGL